MKIYEWMYEQPPVEALRPRNSRAGWLPRLFKALEDLFRFLVKTGDYNRKV